MARVCSRSLFISLYLLSISIYGSVSEQNSYPEFNSLSIININNTDNDHDFKEVEFEVRGRNIYSGMEIRATKIEANENSECKEDYVKNYTIKEIRTGVTFARYLLKIPSNIQGSLYFCLPHNEGATDNTFTAAEPLTWYHQGEKVQLNTKRNDVKPAQDEPLRSHHSLLERISREVLPKVSGLRVEWGENEPSFDEYGVPKLWLGATYKLRLFGSGFNDRMLISFTEEKNEYGNACSFPPNKVYTVVPGSVTKDAVQVKVDLPAIKSSDGFYMCIKADGTVQTQRFIHQGSDNWIKIKTQEKLSRSSRDTFHPRIFGLRVEKGDKASFDDNGIPELLVGSSYTLRFFGYELNDNILVTFTKEKRDYGTNCQFPATGVYPVLNISPEKTTGDITIELPVTADNADTYYICIKEGSTSDSERVASTVPFIHQGSANWQKVKTYTSVIPIWAAIMIICICLLFSALFSGLNLGLMALDRTELKILCNTGTPKERTYAKIITPVRNHGNYLLCSILLGNVLVNSTFTILLDSLTSGLIAVIFSTLSIVIFGEITPQAICSRHGLAVGAKTIYITKLVMLITAPLSYPVSKILDCILGEEIGNVYNRERLKELLKVTTGENDLDRDEVNIISGALELRKKTVAEVMTRIEDVFMLDYDAILDFETVSEIMKSGYSRIPVFEGNKNNIVTMLYIKDLAFVDPDDNTPLKTLCQFYQNPCNFVFEDVTLDVMFKIFKEGNKGHMAFVHRVNSEGEGDPFYETIGLITLEDVIEELIQAEIMDETDVFTDNRTKRKRNADRTKQDFTVFAERRGENNKIRISPQLTLATYQYLSTSIDPFKTDIISETILRRMLKQDIMYHIKKNKDWRNDPATVIFHQGKPVDYFVLILEGRVEVTVGRENLMFESGPFTFFGVQALMQAVGVADSPTTPHNVGSLQSLNMDALLRYTFQPDYSVRASTEVLYLKVKRSLYMAAKRATLMERSHRDTTMMSDQLDDEVEKLLHSLEDDGSIGRQSPDTHSPSHSFKHAASLSQHTTPKTSPISVASPSPNHFSPRDVNGALKRPSVVVDDGILPGKEIATAKDEEISLLTKK